MKVTIRKEKIFGKQAFVVLKNSKPTEFRFTEKGAKALAKRIRSGKNKRKYI